MGHTWIIHQGHGRHIIIIITARGHSYRVADCVFLSRVPSKPTWTVYFRRNGACYVLPIRLSLPPATARAFVGKTNRSCHECTCRISHDTCSRTAVGCPPCTTCRKSTHGRRHTTVPARKFGSFPGCSLKISVIRFCSLYGLRERLIKIPFRAEGGG